MFAIICPILQLLGLYWCSNCGYKLTTVQSGTLWGRALPPSAKQKQWKKQTITKLIIGIALFVILGVPGIGALAECMFYGILGVLFALACLIGFPVVLILGTKNAVKEAKDLVIKELNTDALKDIPLIQAVEEQLDQTQNFIITYEGIGLVDRANYCFASFMFNDYRLGNLNAAELALLAVYFHQKHGDCFVGMPSWDRTFYPGSTVTFLDPDGVYVGKTRSTMTSKLNSYVFSRANKFSNSGNRGGSSIHRG